MVSQHITVVDYNSLWAKEYEEESLRIKDILAENCMATYHIRRVMAVDRRGKAIPPCGVCRELMAQLMPEHYHAIQIMLDYEKKKVVTLGNMTPNWWI